MNAGSTATNRRRIFVIVEKVVLLHIQFTTASSPHQTNTEGVTLETRHCRRRSLSVAHLILFSVEEANSGNNNNYCLLIFINYYISWHVSGGSGNKI
jgi:hypothetical protein